MTRTEVLVLLGILLVLAGVSLGPITAYFERGRITTAMEKARGINTLLAQYATDNNGVYPTGTGTSVPGTSEGIARNLLDAKYAQDAGDFALRGATRYSGTAENFSDFTAANISWDFTGGANATTGITTSAPDLLPVVYCTGETVNYTPGFNVSLSGKGPFETKGIVVAYKGNSVEFIHGNSNQSIHVHKSFISPQFKSNETYTQIRP